ncbi:hypothetical protein B566_EDAN008987 [Ephemera danica]|nr:hypothetical protein B566_EDAN008987 [Ephemera danica]
MRNKSNKDEIAVKKGDVILTCKPFAFVLKSDNQGKRCDFCFKLKSESVTLPRCSKCQFVHYCGPNCQRQAWADHASECAGFKKVAPRIVPDAARLMGKIIMKLRRGGDQEKGQISSTKFRVFKDLMSHYSDVKKDALRMEHYESLVVVLSSFLGADKLPNSAELLGIYGRICVNSFSILDREMLSVGTGVYLAASILDHSCNPTAVATFEGTTLTLRAMQDFPSPLDWTKVRISYIELLASTEERRRELLKSYFFLCDCARCCDTVGEARTLKSMLCTCGQPIPVPDKVADSLVYCQFTIVCL